jgi:tetratricopeptide (TPR) repeat protein
MRKKALLLFATFGAALALVLLVEGVLALCGVGGFDPARDSRLKYQQIFPPLLRPAQLADGRAVLATADPRLAFQWIEPQKSQHALRVLVYGESAIAGLGFSPNVTLVRELERQLQQACPDRALEIVNLGIVALPSKQLRRLVEEGVASYAPDAVVIYCGNNEFLELHAEKYAVQVATPGQKVLRALARSHVYGVLRGLAKPPSRVPDVSNSDLAGNDQRVSEAQMIEQVEVSAAERAELVRWHGDNVRAMAEACRAASVPCLIAAVAVNWEWVGRNDPPAAWIEGYIDGHAGETGLRAAVVKLRAELAAAPDASPTRYLSHWRLAEVHKRLGEWPQAVEQYRASANSDPHLRRCLDVMNAGARAAAEQAGAAFLDTPKELAALHPHGLVGFDDFYDYVHFTPAGAARIGWLVSRELAKLGVYEPRVEHDDRAFLAARVAAFERLERDPYAVGDYLGIGGSRERLANRDLWKYEALLKEYDQRIAADPRDFEALVGRGNARFFQRDGLVGAQADYAAALALRDDPSVRANLAKLLGARRP